MKTVKIFLASSIEDLKEDRVSIGNYFRQLNDIYIKKGIYFELVMCEDYDNAMATGGKQSQYDREIEGSELCFFLFFRKAGEYTRHEFTVAMESFKSCSKPKIITYFKNVAEGESVADEVRAFMAVLDGEFKHYYNTYGHIDTLKLGIIMQIKLMKLDSSEVKVEDGEVKLDGVTVAKSENVPILNGNNNLRSLTEKKRELQAEVSRCRMAYLADPTPDNETAFISASMELNKVSKALCDLEREVLDFMSTVAEMTSDGRVLTHRQKEALEYFNKGDYDTAQQILSDAERENELARAETRAASAMKEILGYIEEDLLWIKAETAKGITKESAAVICIKYEKVTALLEKHNLDRWPLYEYSAFLWKQRQPSASLRIAKKIKWYYGNPDSEFSDERDGKLCNLLGLLYTEAKRLAEAEEYYLKSVKIRERLVAESPDLHQSDLASSYNNLAILYKDTKRFAESEHYHMKSLAIREELSKKSPDTYEPALAVSCSNLGILYKNTKQYDEAESYHLRAVEIRERLCKSDPDTYEPALATSCNNLANVYYSVHSYTKAMEYYLKAIEIRERLARKNPDAFEPVLASAYTNVANLYMSLREHAKSEKYYLRAIEIYKKLCINDPDTYNNDLADVYNNLAILYSDNNRQAEAEEFYLKAADTYKSLCEINPESFERDLADTYNNLGVLYKNTKRYGDAELYYRKAIEIRERLCEKNPAAFEPDLADSYNNIAVLFASTGPYSEAEKYYLKALEIRERMASKNPSAFEPDLGNCCNNLAVLYKKIERYAESEAYFLRAIEIREGLAQRNPALFKPDLASAYKNIGILYDTWGNKPEAIKFFTKARIIFSQSGESYTESVKSLDRLLARLENK